MQTPSAIRSDPGMEGRMKSRVLVVGGSGYLGQHLIQAFSNSSSFDVAFTYHSNLPPLLLHSFPHALPYQLDLLTGHGLDAISHSFGQPHVVVNCAALSIPRACETDPDAAMSTNVPSSLVRWLSSFPSPSPSRSLLIHLSTDQVYQGVKSFYTEDDETKPLNTYGISKLAAEHFIAENYSNFAILRSSIIFGPQSLSPVPKSLPIQWIDGVLSKGHKADFFVDEFRCPIYVKDLVNIIRTLTDRWLTEGKQMKLLLNAGGPDRVSRAQMAETVARVRGYNTSLIGRVSASTVDRGVKSPADISMDISKLIQTLNFSPVSFIDGVKSTLQVSES